MLAAWKEGRAAEEAEVAATETAAAEAAAAEAAAAEAAAAETAAAEAAAAETAAAVAAAEAAAEEKAAADKVADETAAAEAAAAEKAAAEAAAAEKAAAEAAAEEKAAAEAPTKVEAAAALPAPSEEASANGMPAGTVEEPTDTWACPTCTLRNQAVVSICVACGHAKPGSEEPPCDFAPMKAAVKALANASPRMVGLDEELPELGAKSYAHLPNGDCMPHALALGTHYLLERRAPWSNEQHVSLAAQMRSLLHAHMEPRWFTKTGGGHQWSQLVTLEHDTDAAWGNDPDVQMAWCARYTYAGTCTCHCACTARSCTCTAHAMHASCTRHARAMRMQVARRARSVLLWYARAARLRRDVPAGGPHARRAASVAAGPGRAAAHAANPSPSPSPNPSPDPSPKPNQVKGVLQLMQRVPEPGVGQVEAVVRQHVHVGSGGVSRLPQLTAPGSTGRRSRLQAGATHLGRATVQLTALMGGCDVAVRPGTNRRFCSLPHQVLDLQLTGAMDSAAAHYKLLVSGSLRGGKPGKAVKHTPAKRSHPAH